MKLSGEREGGRRGGGRAPVEVAVLPRCSRGHVAVTAPRSADGAARALQFCSVPREVLRAQPWDGEGAVR